MLQKLIPQKKAQIWESAILYLLIISVVIAIVLEAGMPMMNNLRDKSVVMQVRDSFINLDQHIREISTAGPGSQRVVPLETKKGTLKVDDGRILWSMDTEAQIMQPGTSQKFGNIRVGVNADVKASETSNRFIISNSFVRGVFNKIGNSSHYVPINSSSLINHLQSLDTGATVNGTWSFEIDDAEIEGNGYTAMLDKGNDLQEGRVLYHLNLSSGTEHDLTLILRANSDFFIVEMR